MSSRLEINIGGLLHSCEKMIAEKKLKDWRLRKYVEDLGEKLVQLEKELRKPSPDVLKDYYKRVELLKKVLEAENLASTAENIKVMQNIKPGTSLDSGDAVQPTRDVYIKARSTLASQMRSELLGTARPGRGGAAPSSTETSSDVDAVLQHHKQSQERLAEEMVFLAKNMREHALAASNIVREDNRRLTEAEKLALDNTEKLRLESGRLEQHVLKAGKWWMWLALAAVVITFIAMILFMRLFRKPSRS